jgi:hypothetical protein
MKGLVEITKEALDLRVDERRTLARILIELSEEDQDFSPEVQTAWEDEIARRMEAVKSGSAAHSSFQKVFDRLDKHFA